MIFWAANIHQAKKLTRSAVYATAPTATEFPEWSDSTIIFDRNDQPDYVSHPRKSSLVVDPIVDDFCLSRVLMDGGSSINIIFPDMMANMGIPRSHLNHSPTGFHGFVPGRKVQPLGQLDREFFLGDEGNFLLETIHFEVGPLRTGYSAILDRLAYVKFMVLPSHISN